MSASAPPLPVAEALRLVRETARECPLPARECELATALGCLLDEPVEADLDLPPFDKALVDGFAVRSADLAAGIREFDLVGEILAGRTFDLELLPGQTVAIMTGAPMPLGADAVVMVERAERTADRRVRLPGPLAAGRNRLPRATELRKGEVVARPGDRLTPARLGLLASVGRRSVRVRPRPKVAIVSTGDELVGIDQIPGPGQIRNSNSTALAALYQALGASTWESPVAPDDLDRLEAMLFAAIVGSTSDGRPADALVISGGVSAGNRDLVPAALERLGARRIFHQVSVKPGKPLWFGTVSRPGGDGTSLVFGLPGNPVSGLVCSLVFAAAGLEIVSGGTLVAPRVESREIAEAFEHDEIRNTYYPARLQPDGRVRALAWAGSSDLRTIADADGFLVLASGPNRFAAGDRADFLPIPGGFAPAMQSDFGVVPQ
ncbi:MAG: molybdopterin molybdotransferase MoeA [Isosphaeraceae bacterium]|nr:molybdopterin molybdotransferase MoeA [Isosphaeraceae bacterium]